MISEPIRIAYADKRWSSQKAYLDSLARQARAAERLSLVSPAGVFRAVASAVCRTDLDSHERQMDRARRYRETFVGWLQGKDIFESFRWITPTDPATFQDGGPARRKADRRRIQDRTGVRGLGLHAEGRPGPLDQAQQGQGPRRQPG